MTSRELSNFCTGFALLINAAVSLDEGLYAMAEDAESEVEKELLTVMAKELEEGAALSETMKNTNAFPEYVVKMADVGETTGTLDGIMGSLGDFYDREHLLTKAIKSALTYPLIMVFMVLVICFVLFTRVMPIFAGIYEEMGTQLPQLTQRAIELGGVLTGFAIIIILVMVTVITLVGVLIKKGLKVQWAKAVLDRIKSSNKMALDIDRLRIATVMSITIKSGIDLKKGLDMAESLVRNKRTLEMIRQCKKEAKGSVGFYEAVKISGLFTGVDLQLLKVGSYSGRLGIAMDQIAKRYEEEVETSIETMIGNFEPTMVAVLALIVGTILIAVMMPLVGILSSIG